MRHLTMIVCLAVCATILSFEGANAAKCEKWKSEIAKLLTNTTGYGKAYVDYASGKLDETRFATKKKKIVRKLGELKAYILAAVSCDHESQKFEKRKNVLLSWIDKVNGTIESNAAIASDLAKDIRDDFFSK